MAVKARGNSFEADFRHDGKRYRKSFETKNEASLWESETKAALLRGLPVDATTGKIVQVTLLQHVETVFKRRWKGTPGGPGSRKNAMDCVEILGEDFLVSNLDRSAINTVKEELVEWEIESSTVNRKLAALSVLIKEAVDDRLLAGVLKVGLSKESNARKRIFSDVEQTEQLAWCDRNGEDEFRDYICVGYDTGMRQAENLFLKIAEVHGSDINLPANRTKCLNARMIPMTRRVREIVARRTAGKGRNDRLWSLSKRQVIDRWNRMRAELGWSDDPEYIGHGMRHTFVTELLARGVDIRTVQELAGHKQITTTQRYAKTTSERMRQAVDKLNPAVIAVVPLPTDIAAQLVALQSIMASLGVSLSIDQVGAGKIREAQEAIRTLEAA